MAEQKNDFLKLKLTIPVEWQGQEIRELDLSKTSGNDRGKN